jgi:hypothetical protein
MIIVIGIIREQERRGLIMKTLFKKMETLFAAAAFAEEGEFETARQMMKERQVLRKTIRPADRQRPASRPTLRAT